MPTARIAGAGMIPFAKPGRSEDRDGRAEKAIRLALTDASVVYGQIQQAYAGDVYADSTAGQSARGAAERRQAEHMRFGRQHNLGLGGACIVTLYGKAA